jgi:hypothetical protein
MVQYSAASRDTKGAKIGLKLLMDGLPLSQAVVESLLHDFDLRSVQFAEVRTRYATDRSRSRAQLAGRTSTLC